jgi:aspartate aminotransferase
MRAKGLATDLELCERLLDETGVALVPGSAFGAPGHVRLSFAASMATLDAALARLGDFFSK